ncbi:hypothetical protein LOTGIDRAFT_181424 [Lottia gigantea]|uniref:Phosphatidylinositol-glycan biosynthesis class W protein n=1 Tax=Lottia gigantea TaxID=225164 RepID=V4BCY6_LOTGI|nr:hypothetical protein LOTGIDRAFT_181424 [Lottia gigantea]ESP05631.1 hypothetical protein LOTGIDRAFT_181424 [Lottia gigantea]
MNMGDVNVTSKTEHERFVSGHSGTSQLEIALQLSVPVAAVLLRDALFMFLTLNHWKPPLWIRFGIDYMLAVFPLLLMATLLNEFSVKCLMTLLCGGLLLIGMIMVSKKKTAKKKQISWLDINMSGKRLFIDYYRAFINVGTAVVILAVDFQIFPRRFAKTETYGTGLMDSGVGCFVMANAIVSPEARGKHQGDRCKMILNSIKSCLPLVLLGLVRVVSVKNLDYHEHVTEYGVHWNFFITLAAVKIFSTVLFTVFPVSFSGIVSIIIAVLYQYVLSYRGLSDYIRNGRNGQDVRTDLIDANREGIYSSIGYIAIYMAGVQLGTFIFQKRERLYDWCKVLGYIVVICIISNGLLYLVQPHVEPISRRLCNAAYILWMVNLNHILLAGYLIVDMVLTVVRHWCKESLKKVKTKDSDLTSCIISAVNYNGLGFFLLSNLSTGIVNLSIKTIHTPPTLSFIVLFIYTFILSVIIVGLFKFKISLKFW